MSKETVLPPTTVKVGEQFQIIQEDGAASTGYTCALETMPKCVVLLSDEYIPPKTGLLGAPGTRRFTFLAMSSGEGPINFLQIRPWDYKHPAPQGPMDKRFVMVK